MDAVKLKFGLPDIELGSASGSTINPSSFAGHWLIVLFCPLRPVEASAEVGAYLSRAAEFVSRDAWLLTFADGCAVAIDAGGRILTLPDPERHAWVAFRDLTHRPEEKDRDSGAAFLFTRGGSLHRYWHGSGHVEEVIGQLAKPSSDRGREATAGA